MVHPGFLEWATSIRLIMANDPGRTFFHDQVRNHGFLFLEDYLGNILAGPKRDPLIELVKTPGRKRGRNNKRPTAVKSKSKSKSKKTAAVAQEDDIEKENAAPADTFYQTLLQAKMDLLSETDGIRNIPSEPTGREYTRSNEELSRKLEKLQDIVVPLIQETLIEDEATTTSLHPPPSSRESRRTASISETVSLGPPVVESTDLSVIAEGDELAECSHTSIRLSPHGDISAPPTQTSSTSHVVDSTAERVDLASNNFSRSSTRNTVNHDSISSTDSFHSANLSPPTTTQELHRAPPPPDLPSRALTQALKITTSPPAKPTPAENSSTSLPEIPLEHPILRQDEGVTEHLPPFPPADFAAEYTVPLRDAETHTRQELVHKKSIPTLPIFPAPIPPPKNIRSTKDSSSSTVTSTTAPGTAPGGKRSSWLIKAREAKAMEDTTKKFNVLGGAASGTNTAVLGGAALPGMPATLKRKSGELSGDPAITEIGEDGINHKVAKLTAGDVAPTTLSAQKISRERERQRTDAAYGAVPQVSPPAQHQVPVVPQPKEMELEPTEYLVPMRDDQDGILTRLKKTVEGLGARVGKSMGKSLGGATAASLLAEARAAAEAKVVKREIAAGSMETDLVLEKSTELPLAYPGDHSRLSLSDLASTREKQAKTVKSKGIPMQFPSPPVFLPQPPHMATIPDASKTSTSTTPPNSPPQNQPVITTLQMRPIFGGSPVFVPPRDVIPPSREDIANNPLPTFSFVPQPGPKFSSAPAMAPPRPPVALSAQSTLESIASASIFDTQGDGPAWMPTTQDTEYSSVYDSQPQVISDDRHQDKNRPIEDDDDSWPLDEGGPIWNFANTDADDSWSDMDSVAPNPVDAVGTIEQPVTETNLLPSRQTVSADQEFEEEYLGLDESDVEDKAEAGLSTVSLVNSKAMSRSESQLSSSSSSLNLGLLGQAGKLVGSVLGTGKKGKTEVKSLQLAAIAAKKQQEEMDKKAARLKEMENRRQRALQRKAEEEKTRVMQLEKKIKAESERRKKERDEYTDKRPIRLPTEKDDDAANKKRKLVVEIDKKPTKKASANVVKVGPPSKTPTNSKPLAVVVNTSADNASQSTSTAKTADTKTIKTPALKIVIKGNANANGKEDIDPTEAVQAQMSARVKKQMQAAKQAAGENDVPSESIELPDINSEYSDSGDERPPGAFNPPVWAQSPELREALHMQSRMNPDEIFGAVRPLKMEEIFKARTSRFRARTSSANWAGPDGLTVEEEREYARRMGYR